MALRKVFLFNGILTALLVLVGVGCRTKDPIHIKKTGSPKTFTYVGETITYTYEVWNSGDSIIRNITITDDLVEVICPQDYLSYEDSYYFFCSGTYTITEEDVVAGFVTNTVTVQGYQDDEVCDCSQDLRVTDTAEFTVTFNGIFSLQMTKIGTPNWFDGPDQQIAYTYTVENTGTVSLVGPVMVSDDLESVNCPGGDLKPGESMLCTASYTTTADDVLAEEITNTATASMGGITSNTEIFTVYFEASPELTLTKSAEWTIFSYEGQLINYTFELTNTGNVTIHPPFEPDDPMLEDWDCPDEPLEPGEWFICTGEYYVLAGDINTTLRNCATVMGIYKDGQVISNEACTEVFYQVPPEETTCEKNPNSWDCYCEQHPNHPDCP